MQSVYELNAAHISNSYMYTNLHVFYMYFAVLSHVWGLHHPSSCPHGPRQNMKGTMFEIHAAKKADVGLNKIGKCKGFRSTFVLQLMRSPCKYFSKIGASSYPPSVASRMSMSFACHIHSVQRLVVNRMHL